MTRTAISPLLATRSLENTARADQPEAGGCRAPAGAISRRGAKAELAALGSDNENKEIKMAASACDEERDATAGSRVRPPAEG
jgi:hypothetical protein